MNNDFFPDAYNGVPKAPSNYMKLEEGKNIFRVLSSAIVGYEWWVDTDEGQRKPKRVKDIDDVPDQFLNNEDNRKNAKYFWAFVVYNPKDKMVQILEIKQKKIMTAMEALVRSESWGDPKEYDIVITRTKTGSEPRDVEYSVMPEPKKKVDAGVKQLYSDMDIQLDELYKGGDPFAPSENAESIADSAVQAGI